MTIVETRRIAAGVDTHLDLHVVAVIDEVSGVIAVEPFPSTVAGYRHLTAWLQSFGTVLRVGVEAPAPMAPG
ncbi:MAG: hypothetical protein ACLGI2_06665 [Acidimicrobiia bacterium]